VFVLNKAFREKKQEVCFNVDLAFMHMVKHLSCGSAVESHAVTLKHFTMQLLQQGCYLRAVDKNYKT